MGEDVGDFSWVIACIDLMHWTMMVLKQALAMCARIALAELIWKNRRSLSIVYQQCFK